ncbi:MAG: hypothetical protein ACM3PP_12465 [Candidatus Saccharibacteria bacterium]
MTVTEINARNQNIPEELNNSLEKILLYADLPQERSEIFKKHMDIFRNLKDKSFMDSDSRRVREVITSVFFELYPAVLKKAVREDNQSPLLKMFLAFCFVDEKLLKPEEISQLYSLLDQPCTNPDCSIFSLKDWMEMVYNREKEPSVNEFEQDYYDVFRDKKKRGELSENDKLEYENNADGRLEHEVNNLFKLGQRLCYGQMGGYFPVLHSGMIARDLIKSVVTPQMIQESINKILAVDFSVFHREIVINDQDRGMRQELVMKSVFPEFIVVPTFGARSVMWQEIAGRVRSNPGRVLIPIFTTQSLDELMVDMVAKFRWELSKTMNSYSRGDGPPNSLCAEYIDYIQFYKKNRDLSEDAREKVKRQIDRHRNNPKDIFVDDYATWINFESKGMIRLNKVAREILFKYCPFSKPLRSILEKQPLFNPLVTRYDNMQARQLKNLEARYAKLVKPGEEMASELAEHIEYYRS